MEKRYGFQEGDQFWCGKHYAGTSSYGLPDFLATDRVCVVCGANLLDRPNTAREQKDADLREAESYLRRWLPRGAKVWYIQSKIAVSGNGNYTRHNSYFAVVDGDITKLNAHIAVFMDARRDKEGAVMSDETGSTFIDRLSHRLYDPDYAQNGPILHSFEM